MKLNIKKIKNILSKPQNVATGTLSIMLFSIISKIFGFFREMLLAYFFGTSWRLDALVVAMEPAVRIGGIVSGAIAYMMVPIYIGIKKKDFEKTKEYTTQILFISSLLLIGFGVLFSLFPGFFIKIFAPNFNGKEFDYAFKLMRLIGFLPLLQGFHALAISFLNADKKYMLSAIIQLIFNLTIIPVIIILAPILNEQSYLFGYIFATALMDIVLVLVLRKRITLNSVLNGFKNSSVKETLLLALPLLLSGSLGIINGIVDKAFASSLVPGSISALRFAQTIRGLISSLIIGSLMTTIFTELSEISISDNTSPLRIRLKKTTNDLMNFLTPLTMWLIIMSKPLIKIIYERGQFTEQSTNMVSLALIGYSLTLIFTPISNLLLHVFTAYKKTQIPFFITILSIILNFVFNALLIEKLGILGITLSTSCVALLNLIVLNFLQKKTFGIKFIDKRNILLLLRNSIFVFLLSILLRNNIHYILWLIISNSSFLLLFLHHNWQILNRIISKIKRRIT